ncbi:hypothetical protein IAQ00_20285 [Pantoea ananatis]|uniref:hypothetical protein n=1 Tax=Pantoea ananas TaxID=553 RepID=UPI0020796466|nr:hypothetical protein [Pantoea ananatis]USL57938.1 hypothetical protein IAQ00_20285 [Pantoea ananatis]
MNIDPIVQPATKDGGFFHFIRAWVVMFKVAEHPYRYHFDVRFSLIADIGLLADRFVPQAELAYIMLC